MPNENVGERAPGPLARPPMPWAASRAVAVLAAKAVAEDIQASLKHVIPEGLRLAQQDLHRQRRGSAIIPGWLMPTALPPSGRTRR